MSEDASFALQEETDSEVKNLATSENVVLLCCIAPFTATRISPTRTVSASFRFPDEFVVEEFVELINGRYPNKDSRPPLFLMIHSPGGTVSSSYVVCGVLRNCFNSIIAFVPHIAASGASVMALSCNEVVMGDISRLTGIDPYHEANGDVVFSLSTVRAFDNLVNIFRTRTEEETPYPYRHLLRSITAQDYDEATHTLSLVDSYTSELMTKAGYIPEDIKQVLRAMLYEVQAHEEVFLLDKVKELKVKAKRYDEDARYSRTWKVMKQWLKKYYLQPSPVHIIKYALPATTSIPATTSSGPKDEKDNKGNA